MKKPSNRKERLMFIAKKQGIDTASNLFLLTDKEVKHMFDLLYPKIKNMPDYDALKNEPICIRCGVSVETEFHTYCNCGEDRAIFSQEEWIRDIMSHTDSQRCEEDAAFIKNGFRVPKQ